MRIKTKVLHPMDTGLVLDNDGNVIPEYYIDRMEFSDDSGLIAIIETFAALSANPMVMLDLPDRSQNVRINMSDSKDISFVENAVSVGIMAVIAVTKENTESKKRREK